MKTVFVVTIGEYDDYRIVGVFSTKEKAEGYGRRYPDPTFYGYTRYSIEEWTVDLFDRVEL